MRRARRTSCCEQNAASLRQDRAVDHLAVEEEGSGSAACAGVRVADFDPVFAELTKISDDDPGVLYRPDDHATPSLPVADRLTAGAREAASSGETGRARDLHLRAAAVYRIAWFPINRSPLSQQAWEKGKAARHRHWGAGLVAAVSGSVVVFTSVDRLRPHLDRLLADTTATAAGLVVAMAVFTLCSRVQRRA